MKLSDILTRLPEMLATLKDRGATRVCVHNFNSDDLMESGSCPLPLLLYGNITDVPALEITLEDLLGCRVDIRCEADDRRKPSVFARAAVDLPTNVADAKKVLLELFNSGTGYGKHQPPFLTTDAIEFDDFKIPTFKRRRQDLVTMYHQTMSPAAKRQQPKITPEQMAALVTAINTDSQLTNFFVNAEPEDFLTVQAALRKRPEPSTKTLKV